MRGGNVVVVWDGRARSASHPWSCAKTNDLGSRASYVTLIPFEKPPSRPGLWE